MGTLLATMQLLLFVLFPAVHGLSSSELYDYQITSLKPLLISIRNEGGLINVTVKYKHDSLVDKVSTVWWINGRPVSNGSNNFRINNFEIRGFDFTNTEISYSSLTPPDKYTPRTSILIPEMFNMTSLQLTLVSGPEEITMDINVLRPLSGRTSIELVPEFKMEVSPEHLIAYGTEDRLQLKVSFTSKDLDRENAKDITAEYIGIDQCINPARIVTKNSNMDSEFLKIWTPTWDDDIDFREMYRIEADDYVVGRLNITKDNVNALPRGILKISSGYRSRSPCSLFGGVKVTKVSFLLPPPHSNITLFPENTLAFVQTNSDYVVNCGESIDIKLTAIGGLFEERPFRERIPTSPQITVRRGRQKVPVVANVKRFFEREITMRITNATVETSGRYVAIAQLGRQRVKRDINVYVRNAPCGQ